MASELDDAPAELEHVIGFSCRHANTYLSHPTDINMTVHSVGQLVIVGDLSDPHKQDILRYHDAEVCAVAISPCGQYIASGQIATPKGMGSPLVLWDVATRKRLFDLEGLASDCQYIHFSPDTKMIAAADDHGFFIWDLDTGDLVLSQKPAAGQAFSTFAWGSIHEGRSKRNASYLIATTSASTLLMHLLMFDVKTMHYVLQTSNMQLPSRGFVRRYVRTQFSDNFEQVFCATREGDLGVFNVPNSIFRTTLNVGPNGVSAFATRGDVVYAGAGDGVIRKFQGVDLAWQQTAEARLGARILSLNLLADGEQLLVSTAAGALWRLRTSDLSAVKVGEAVTASAAAVAFGTQRSDQFATLSTDGAFKIWDLNSYLALAAASTPGQPMAGSVLQYTADSQTVVAGYVNGRMAGYSARDGAELWNLPSAHRGAVNCITVTDKLLVTGGADGVTRVWLASNHAFVTQLNSHAMKPVVGVRIDCRQPHLLHSAGLDRSVTIFDLKTEGRIVTHQLREGSNMTGLTQRSDSEQESITSTSDGRLCFWDVDVQPHPVATIQDESRVKINSIALGPGGRYLAAALEDTTVKVFDIQSLTLVATLSAHSGPVTSVAWSPDQRQLVSVGTDCTICVWNFYLD